jgi:NCAIR mutase (PurE)-related protein
MTEVLKYIKQLPFEDLDFAKIDHHRAVRTGYPEVVFCAGKTVEQVVKIYRSLQRREDSILLTRATSDMFEKLQEEDSRLVYNACAKTIVLEAKEKKKEGSVLVISAGTADLPVAEEAAVTASVLGAQVERVYDVGVAGIHRLLAYVEKIQSARCIVVVAGMEGALPSVVGGLASCPIIGVPTSVGYGSNLGGFAPLLTMLNSCAPNITVVNIDNGFGGGFSAAMINAKKSE